MFMEFFETRHGKGEHDGVGACIKRSLRRYQMNHSAYRLANSSDVVNWCKQNLNHEFNERMANVRRYVIFSMTLNVFKCSYLLCLYVHEYFYLNYLKKS